MILIVDDHKDTAALLVRLLKFAGHSAVSVAGGAEALTLLQNRKPKLMILDMNMPEMDGLTVLKKVRQLENLKDVAVLVYSADTHGETIREAGRLGAADYVIKGSIPFENLLARISKLAGDPSSSTDC